MEDNHSFFLGKAGVASLSLAQLTPSLFIYLVQLKGDQIKTDDNLFSLYLDFWASDLQNAGVYPPYLGGYYGG